jgi:hypothetical protein
MTVEHFTRKLSRECARSQSSVGIAAAMAQTNP